MDYDEVISAFFVPTPEGTVPEPTRRSGIARRLRDAIEPIAMHPVWSRRNNAALADLGLDFFSGYAWSRAAALGEPSPGVVAATFAVFEPGMISGAYEAGRAACGRTEMLAAREVATTASLAEVLAGADVAAAADRLYDAVIDLDRAGRPIYAGLADIAIPTDPMGRLWRSAEMIREHRGDSHIAACVARGLDPAEMNILTELWVGMEFGTYSASRGWDEATLHGAADALAGRGLLDGHQLTDAGRAFRDAIEDDTDRAQAQLVGALGEDVDDLIADLDSWSARCVAAAAFPPDAYKRAAG